uniref:potassium channel subfamily K member 13 n=1 Tax=Myxine glutinosa TaxID=7769 RepID=UPI00358F3548
MSGTGGSCYCCCCCCCYSVLGSEDNVRFALLALIILAYLLGGAAVFSALELPTELETRQRWRSVEAAFAERHNVNRSEITAFLRAFEQAALTGAHSDALRPRWDFSGALYFVGTVVSTIGFGMTTPTTTAGKIFLIFYGLLGCSATILFFNLFLERLITLLACAIKACHKRRQHLHFSPASARKQRRVRGDQSEANYSSVAWKPSVYQVMTILGLAAIAVGCTASVLYSAVEGWSYIDSLYFCFVAFSTIGFGDMVSSQKDYYLAQGAYRLANFLLVLAGVCCIYSLFNVISIVIKQSLNWILRRTRCQHHCVRHLLRPIRRLQQNAVVPGGSRHGPWQVESDIDGRRASGEMISMRDFLASNKVSLALMQKQLSEAANGSLRVVTGVAHHQDNGFAAGVGALAIMNNRLAETSGGS